MNTYKAPILSGNKTLNNTRFSKEALEQISKIDHVIPVRIGFQGIPNGVVTKLELINNVIICTIMTGYKDEQVLGKYLVPMGAVTEENIFTDQEGVVNINKMDILEVSITSYAADPSLTTIKKEK